MSALYLALTVEGMFLEMSHGFPRVFDPLTVCTYEVDVADVVDLRTDDLRVAAGISIDDMACAWEFELSMGRRPSSWAIYDRLNAAGISGLLVPSFARGARPDMSNLVLWQWGEHLPRRIKVHDPSGRLPRNQLSWR